MAVVIEGGMISPTDNRISWIFYLIINIILSFLSYISAYMKTIHTCIYEVDMFSLGYIWKVCVCSSVWCPHSTQTTNPPNRHESINVRIREDSWNFANFLSKSWRSKIMLRYRYDRVTNIRGIRLESLKYCHEFTTIYKNRLRILHER